MSSQVTREVAGILAAFVSAIEESEVVSESAVNHIRKMVLEGKMADAEEVNSLVALLQEETSEPKN